MTLGLLAANPGSKSQGNQVDQGEHSVDRPIPAATVSDRSSTRDQVVDEHDDCENKQQVDEAAGDVKGKAQKPKYEQDYKDGPKHGFLQCSLKLELRLGDGAEMIVANE